MKALSIPGFLVVPVMRQTSIMALAHPSPWQSHNPASPNHSLTCCCCCCHTILLWMTHRMTTPHHFYSLKKMTLKLLWTRQFPLHTSVHFYVPSATQSCHTPGRGHLSGTLPAPQSPQVVGLGGAHSRCSGPRAASPAPSQTARWTPATHHHHCSVTHVTMCPNVSVLHLSPLLHRF